MYGGDLPSYQSTSISRPGEDESRSSRGNPDSSKPSSQSDDDDDDVSMVPVHPSFLAEYGVDVVMG